MKVSSEIASAARLVGEEKAIELMAKAGFDAWDFSMFDMCRYDWANRCLAKNDHPLAGNDYLAFARKLKQVGLDNGIVCNQSHAPFPVSVQPIRDHLQRALECTAEAGGKICVIHPNNDLSPEENAEMYLELLPFAKEVGVKIATENMWNWNRETDEAAPAACSDHVSFPAHLAAVNDDAFVACLDIGHAEMKGLGTDQVRLIHALGDKLQALHLHDNDRWHDNHQIPFSMNINFNDTVSALKEIGYQGYFTLEADSFLRAYTAKTAFDGILALAESVKKLAAMFEAQN